MSKDPINDLANGLAADHAAEKGAKKAKNKAAKPATGDPENPPAQEGDAKFVGDFESFDAVREFANSEGFNLEAGDMTVINGALCRYTGKVFEVVADLLNEYAAPADHIESFNASLASIERVVLGARFESGTLMANLRDVVIGIFKARPKAWTEMSNAEQRDLVKQVEGKATDIIRKVARVVAEGDKVSVTGKLERYTHSGAFDLKISSPAERETATMLFEMQGHDIIITSADAKRFIDGAPEAITDADEPELFPSASEGTPVAELAPKEPPADDSDLAEVDENSEAGAEVVDPAAETAENGPAEVEEAGAETNVVPIGKAAEEKPVSLIDQCRGADTVKDIDGPLEDGRAPGDYESRSNPDDDKPEADFHGVQPADAKPGQTWLNSSDPRLRWLHPNGKWYLTAPTEEVIAEWRAANEQPEDFGDEPVA